MKEPRIYERNPDTGVIRSRPFGNYDPEQVAEYKKNGLSEKKKTQENHRQLFSR